MFLFPDAPSYDKEEVGEPVFLTPLIRADRIEEARNRGPLVVGIKKNLYKDYLYFITFCDFATDSSCFLIFCIFRSGSGFLKKFVIYITAIFPKNTVFSIYCNLIRKIT